MRNPEQSIFIWAGPAAVVCFVVALLPLAHFVPPMSPLLTSTEVADVYQGNRLGIQLGSILLMLAVIFYLAFSAAISSVITQMRGPLSPLPMAQMLGGLMLVLTFTVSALFWVSAAYRAERAPELTYLLNDLAWLFLVVPGPNGILQPIVIAIAIFADKSNPRVMPRWVAYFNVWCAILFVPGSFAAIFKTGPFAWDGVLSFWIPASLFGLYTGVMTTMLLRANKAAP